jgi:hypothetical protein
MNPKDPDLKAAVDQAAMALLGKEIEGAVDANDPARKRQRRIAVEILQRAGVLELLRAISADGELRPPPPWPEADIVPIGGGPGFLDVEVRTFVKGRGALKAPLHIRIEPGKPPTQDQIGEVYQYGYWMLNRWMGKVQK